MNEFLELIRMSVLGAMPQTFTGLLFAMSFLKRTPEDLFKRILWFTVLHSLYTDTMQLVLPLPLHLVNSLIAQIVLFLLLFRSLNVRQNIAIFILINVILITMDLIGFGIAKYWIGIDTRDDLLYDQFWRYFPVIMGQSLLMLFASFYIRKNLLQKKLQGLKNNFYILILSGRGKLGILIVLIFIQFYLLVFLQNVQYTNENHKTFTISIVIYAVIAISLVALVLIAQLIIRTREHAVRATQDIYVDDINHMFASIRGQRHDFINHLQVIHTMSQMNKTSDLQKYVCDLVHETQEMSEIVNHASPALAAFVQAKATVAIAKGIAFSFELPQQQSLEESSIRTIDIIKILGNLVDNAFDEVASLPPGKRMVWGSIRYIDQHLVMEVANMGRILSSEEQKKIFTAGFTTKPDGKHSGLGLAIVSERTKHYGGTFSLQSDASNGTIFRVSIPQIEVVAESAI